MKNLFLFLFILLTVELYSQIHIDTSYTALSVYNKEIKKFPFIKIVYRNSYKDVTQINDLVYKKIDDRLLHLDAFLKNETSSQPAIILIHGGGWKSGNKSHMNFLAQEIASKGYACFSVEYRLSNEAKYPAAIFDVKEAIKYVKANAVKFNVDKSKIAVLGCSSGGQMAALIGTTNGNLEFQDRSELNQSSDVQAIINMDGVLAFHHHESKEADAAAKWLGGSYEEKPEVWQQASALHHTDNDTPPVLFINSSLPRFHAGRDDMIAILDKFNIYNEVKEIPNSPHSFWFFDPWFDEIVNYSVEFLDKIFKKK